MNKPLLQYKREIEYRKNNMGLNCSQIDGMFVNPIEGAMFNEINRQLQMIDDIIETANYLERNILIVNANESAGIRKFKERLIGE